MSCGDVAYTVLWKCDDCGSSDIMHGWTRDGSVRIAFRCHCNPVTPNDEES